MSNTETTIDTAPETLMRGFRGRGFTSMLLFTVVAHAALILGTSLPGLIRGYVSGEEGELTADQRADLAVKEATASLREIAQRHGLTTQELSTRFAPAPAAPAAAPTGTPPAGDPPPDTTPTPGPPPIAADPATEEPRSTIEQELETATPGPAIPPIPETTEEDLFE